jgi:hypothetical protein
MKPEFAVMFWVAIVLIAFSPSAIVAKNQDAKESAKVLTRSDHSVDENNGANLDDSKVSTVGFPKLIFQHVIPGPKVIAKPIADPAQPMIVRIVDTYSHGTDFRYDIEYKGLDAGRYDLADFLEREDGSQSPIPAITVEVKSLLGPGQVLPYELPPVKSGFRSFYLPAILLGAAVWLGGLLMILFYGRGKDKRPSQHKQQLTVADRMRPLIDAAMAGELDAQEQAELERVLSAFWSKKLRLNHLAATDLREKLRSHPEASVMLTQIDAWLHRPATDPQNQVDVNEILKPYQSMNYEEV